MASETLLHVFHTEGGLEGGHMTGLLSGGSPFIKCSPHQYLFRAPGKTIIVLPCFSILISLSFSGVALSLICSFIFITGVIKVGFMLVFKCFLQVALIKKAT